MQTLRETANLDLPFSQDGKRQFPLVRVANFGGDLLTSSCIILGIGFIGISMDTLFVSSLASIELLRARPLLPFSLGFSRPRYRSQIKPA